MKMFWNLIKISLNFVPNGPINMGLNNCLALSKQQAILPIKFIDSHISQPQWDTLLILS